ncbi:thermonuclease family protein [Acidobacteriota bacterium]
MPKIFNSLFWMFCVVGIFFLFLGLTSEKEFKDSEKDSGVIYVVYDGDTVGIEYPNGRKKKIRLIGIDSPETSHANEQVRLLAQLSKRFTFYFLYNKQVTLTHDWEREDKYGRLLAYIWTEENGLFNEFILKEGFASAYLRFPFKEEYRQKFIRAEKSAQSLNMGLWREEPYPTVPIHKISNFIGQTAAVQYTCQDVQEKGKFNFLYSDSQLFSALIPNNRKKFFADVKNFEGQLIRVQGFVEEYGGQPQIIAFFPQQIKAVGINRIISIRRERLK